MLFLCEPPKDYTKMKANVREEIANITYTVDPTRLVSVMINIRKQLLQCLAQRRASRLIPDLIVKIK